MTTETGNVQGRKENRGSSGNNVQLQKAQSGDPDKSNARDREGRKGGDNARKL
jgi:hypothetical protein